jgi:hypothetical protein
MAGELRHGRRNLLPVVALLLSIALFACSQPDPIVGSWQFSHGVTLAFEAGGGVKGKGPRDEPLAGTWERKDNSVRLDGGVTAAFDNQRTFLITKLEANAIYLKGAESGQLFSATRAH